MKSTELAKRLEIFARDIVTFCKQIHLDTVSRPLVSQLIRAATSIGANYAEAQNGISRSDFRAKVFICKKEAQETVYWLKLFPAVIPKGKLEDLKALSQEATEIVKILQAITAKLQ